VAIYDKEVPENVSIHNLKLRERKIKLNRKQKLYYKFTFVRNPYLRLLSCYNNKYINGCNDEMKYYLGGYLYRVNTFEEFVNKVIKIPTAIMDRHIIPQFNVIYKNNNCLVDYVGKFENISEDFGRLQKKYNFKELKYLNKSKDVNWEEFYTEELKEKVYLKYKKDFEIFGYKK
jgi:hypothetical protein